MDLRSAIVMNEAQFLEFVHEQIHPRPQSFPPALPANVGKHLLRLRFLAVASELQKSPSQPFLGPIEKLIKFLDLMFRESI